MVVLSAGCGAIDLSPADSEDDAEPTSAVSDGNVVGCGLGEGTEETPGDGSIDLGVAVLEQNPGQVEAVEGDGDGLSVRFDVVVDAAVDDLALVVLQARGAESKVLLRSTAVDAEQIGAEGPATVVGIGLRRCGDPRRYGMELSVTGPDCVTLIGSDPATATFTQITVPIGVAACEPASLADDG